MNIFKKIYCRTTQFIFRLALPFLPYREPVILNSNDETIEVLSKQGKHNIMLITGKKIKSAGLTAPLETALTRSKIAFQIFTDVASNPTSNNVEDAVKIYKENNCDAIIAIGGGSVIDLAKALGARIAYPTKTLFQMKGVMKVLKKIPLLIAIPTTAGTGSETTVASVITDSKTHHKYAINSFPLIPSYTMLDASLTVNLPKSITASTGMDALTHAVEAFIGNSTTKATRKHAKDAIKLIFENLETAYNNGSNLTARQNMLIASYKAGLAFTKSYVGYVHAIAHALGGKYNLPHGKTNAIVLPYVLKAYGKSVYKKLYKLGLHANLFDKSVSYKVGAEIFIAKIEELNKNMEIGSHIPEIELEDIKNLASTAEKEANPLYPVPKLFDAKSLENLIISIKG